jgi:serine/threonine-protein kinase RsbW
MEKPEISGDAIIIPSDAAFLAAVDEFIENKLINVGVSSSLVADMAISVTEIVNNAIVHGNKNNSNKIIAIKVKFIGNDAIVSIKDQGQGFNPDIVPNPIEESNLLNKVGRGIFIVRALMDSVNFHFTDTGTEVVLKKRIKK